MDDSREEFAPEYINSSSGFTESQDESRYSSRYSRPSSYSCSRPDSYCSREESDFESSDGYINELERDCKINPPQLFLRINFRMWDEAISLIEINPLEAQTWVTSKFDDGRLKWRYLPIHLACIHSPESPPLHLFEALINAYPRGSKSEDHEGNLPIHIACGNSAVNSNETIMKLLIQSYPKSVDRIDSNGQKPADILHGSQSSNKDAIIRLMNQVQKDRSKPELRVKPASVAIEKSPERVEILKSNPVDLHDEDDKIFEHDFGVTISYTSETTNDTSSWQKADLLLPPLYENPDSEKKKNAGKLRDENNMLRSKLDFLQKENERLKASEYKSMSAKEKIERIENEDLNLRQNVYEQSRIIENLRRELEEGKFSSKLLAKELKEKEKQIKESLKSKELMEHSFKQKISSLESDHVIATAEISALQAAMEEMNQTKSFDEDSNKKGDEVSKINEKLQNDLKKLTSINASNEDVIQNITTKNKSLQQKVEYLDKTNFQKEVEIEELKNEIDTLQDDISKVNDERKKDKQMLEDLSKKHDRYRAKNSDLTKHIERLEKRCDEYETKIYELEDTQESLEDEKFIMQEKAINNLMKNSKVLENDNEVLSEMVEELKYDKSALKNKVKELSKNIRNHVHDLSDIMSAYESLKKEQEESNDIIFCLKQDFNQERENYESEMEILKKRLEKAHTNNDANQKKFDSLTETVDFLQLQIEGLELKIDELEKGNEQLEKEKAENMERVKMLENYLDDAADLKSRISDMSVKEEALLSELSALGGTINGQNEQIDSLKKHIDLLTQEKRRILREKTELKSTISLEQEHTEDSKHHECDNSTDYDSDDLVEDQSRSSEITSIIVQGNRIETEGSRESSMIDPQYETLPQETKKGNALELQVEELLVQNKELQNKNASLQKMLVSYTEEKATRQAKSEEEESLQGGKENAIVKYDEISQSKYRVPQSKHELSSVSGEISQSTYDRLQSEKEKLTLENERLIAICLENDATLSEMASEIQSLNSSKSKLNNEKIEVETSLANALDDIKGLKDNYKEMEINIRRELSKKIESLNMEVSRLIKQNSELEEKLKNEKKTFNEIQVLLEKNVLNSDESVKAMQERCLTLTQENSRLKELMEKLEEQNVALSELLAEEKALHDATIQDFAKSRNILETKSQDIQDYATTLEEENIAHRKTIDEYSKQHESLKLTSSTMTDEYEETLIEFKKQRDILSAKNLLLHDEIKKKKEEFDAREKELLSAYDTLVLDCEAIKEKEIICEDILNELNDEKVKLCLELDDYICRLSENEETDSSTHAHRVPHSSSKKNLSEVSFDRNSNQSFFQPIKTKLENLMLLGDKLLEKVYVMAETQQEKDMIIQSLEEKLERSGDEKMTLAKKSEEMLLKSASNFSHSRALEERLRNKNERIAGLKTKLRESEKKLDKFTFKLDRLLSEKEHLKERLMKAENKQLEYAKEFGILEDTLSSATFLNFEHYVKAEEVLTEYNALKKHFDETLSSHLEKRKEMVAELTSAHNILEFNKQSNQVLREENNRMADTVSALKDENYSLYKEIESYNSQKLVLGKNKADVQRLKDQVKVLTTENSALKERNKNQDESFRRHQESLSEQLITIEEAVKNNAKIFQEEATELTSMNDKLQLQNATLQEKIMDAEKLIENLNLEDQNSKEKIVELNATLNDEEKKLMNCNEELSKLKLAKEELQKQQAQTEKELHEKNEALQQENNQIGQKLCKNANELAAYMKNLEQLTTEYKDLQAECTQIIGDLRTKHSILKSENEKLNETLETNVSEFAALKGKHTQTVGDLAKQLEEVTQSHERLQSELADTKKVLLTEVATLSDKIVEQTDIIDSINIEKTKLLEQKENIEIQIKEKEENHTKELNSLRDTITTLEKQVTASQEEVAALQEEESMLQEEVKSLQIELCDIKELKQNAELKAKELEKEQKEIIDSMESLITRMNVPTRMHSELKPQKSSLSENSSLSEFKTNSMVEKDIESSNDQRFLPVKSTFPDDLLKETEGEDRSLGENLKQISVICNKQKNEISTCHTKLEELKTQKEALTNEKRGLKRDLEKALTLSRKYNSQIIDMSEDCRVLDEGIRAKEKKFIEEETRLNREMEFLKKEINDQKQKINELQIEKKQLCSEIEHLMYDNSVCSKKIEDLTQEYRSVQDKNVTMKTKLLQFSDKSAIQKDLIGKMNSRLEEVTLQKRNMLDDIAVLREKVKLHEETNKELNLNYEKIEAIHQKRSMKIQKMAKDIDVLKTKVSNLIKEKENLGISLNKVRNEKATLLTILSTNKTSYETDLKKMKEKEEKLQKGQSFLKDVVTGLKKQKDSAEMKIVDLNERHSVFLENIASMNCAMEDISKVCDTLRDEKMVLAEKRLSLESNCFSVVNALKNSQEWMKEENIVFMETISRLKQENLFLEDKIKVIECHKNSHDASLGNKVENMEMMKGKNPDVTQNIILQESATENVSIVEQLRLENMTLQQEKLKFNETMKQNNLEYQQLKDKNKYLNGRLEENIEELLMSKIEIERLKLASERINNSDSTYKDDKMAFIHVSHRKIIDLEQKMAHNKVVNADVGQYDEIHQQDQVTTNEEDMMNINDEKNISNANDGIKELLDNSSSDMYVALKKLVESHKFLENQNITLMDAIAKMKKNQMQSSSFAIDNVCNKDTLREGNDNENNVVLNELEAIEKKNTLTIGSMAEEQRLIKKMIEENLVKKNDFLRSLT